MPQTPGALPTALPSSGIRDIGPCAAACSISRIAARNSPASSIRLSRSFSGSAKSKSRYDLWGHPGKITVTGFLTAGARGFLRTRFARLRSPAARPISPPSANIKAAPASSLNIEQEITADLGVFAARRLGRRQHRAVRISPISTAPSPAAFRSTASNGADRTTRSALPASSTALRACTKLFSMPAAWAS